MNADEVQADQTGESQPVTPIPKWPDVLGAHPQNSEPRQCSLCSRIKPIDQFTPFRPHICSECAEEDRIREVAEFLSEPPEQTFGPSQAEEIRLGTWHARQTPADGPTVENPWMKAERLEKELAAEKRVSESLTERFYASEFACRDLEKKLAAAMEALTNERQVSRMCRFMEKEILELRDARQSLEKQLEELRQYIRDEGWKMELDEANVQYRKLREQLPKGMEHCTILFKECPKGHGRLTATNWTQHGCQTCDRQLVEKDRDSWKISAQRWVDHADGLQDELQVAKRTAADLKLLLAEAKSIEKTKEFVRNWDFAAFCAIVFVAIGVAVAVLFKR